MVQESEDLAHVEEHGIAAVSRARSPERRSTDDRPVFLGSLLGAMALGIPIAFALLVCGAALMWHLDMFDAQILAQNVINGADSFPLLAVPFFMLAGEIMNVGRPLAAASSTSRSRWSATSAAASATSPSWPPCMHGGAVGLGGGRHRGARRAAAADDGEGRPRQGHAPAA